MAMTAVFTTIGGQMYHENRGGTESLYIPDPLGSLIACKNTSGTTTYTAEYWPYGEVRTETGTNPSKWGFVGLLGYLADFASLLYVRARFYKPNLGRWSTVDPIWPFQGAYSYASLRPTFIFDPTGLCVWSGGMWWKALVACGSAVTALIGQIMRGDPFNICDIGGACLGAVLGLIFTCLIGVPGIGDCIGGAIGAAVGAIFDALCSAFGNPPCEKDEPWQCVLGDILISAMLGCISGAVGGGGQGGAVDYWRNLVYGLLNAKERCNEGFVTPPGPSPSELPNYGGTVVTA